MLTKLLVHEKVYRIFDKGAGVKSFVNGFKDVGNLFFGPLVRLKHQGQDRLVQRVEVLFLHKMPFFNEKAKNSEVGLG